MVCVLWVLSAVGGTLLELEKCGLDEKVMKAADLIYKLSLAILDGS